MESTPTLPQLHIAPFAVVAALHLAACTLFALALLWDGPASGAATLTMGVALAAYLLGVRHAFDPDHIVAIDNTTRYLRARDLPAGSVGFWFSLGHSSVVFLACVLLGFGWRAIADQLSGSETAGATAAGIWGPAVSGTFLIAIAMVNTRILVDLWRHRREPSPDGLRARGLFTGILSKRLSIRRPRQMLLVGFLFGLGFDTATSVGLLLLAAGGAQATLPWAAFLALPLMFAAGMTLFDSLDGLAMNRAYGWADSGARRWRHNIAVTALSVLAALATGGVVLSELIGKLLPK
jgi:high-affinity nickel-transport protein